jgi:hypothetical protein
LTLNINRKQTNHFPMKLILKVLKGLFAGKRNIVIFDDHLYKTNDDIGHC